MRGFATGAQRGPQAQCGPKKSARCDTVKNTARPEDSSVESEKITARPKSFVIDAHNADNHVENEIGISSEMDEDTFARNGRKFDSIFTGNVGMPLAKGDDGESDDQLNVLFSVSKSEIEQLHNVSDDALRSYARRRAFIMSDAIIPPSPDDRVLVITDRVMATKMVEKKQVPTGKFEQIKYAVVKERDLR